MRLFSAIFRREVAGFLCLCFAMFTLWLAFVAFTVTSENKERARTETYKATVRIAEQIGASLAAISLAASDVKRYLYENPTTQLDSAKIADALEFGSINHDGFYSLGLAFEQGVVALESDASSANDPESCGAAYCRFAPVIIENDAFTVMDRLDNYYDYLQGSDEQWYRSAIAKEKGWGIPRLEKAYDEWVMTYTEQVLDRDGRPEGVVFADVDLSWFKEQMENHDLWHNGYAIVVNHNHGHPEVLYHGLVSTESVRENLERQNPQEIDAADASQFARAAPEFIDEEVLDLLELPNNSRVTNQLTGAAAWLNRASIDGELELITVMNYSPGIENPEYEAIADIRSPAQRSDLEPRWRHLFNMDVVNDSGLVTMLVSLVLLASLAYGYFAISFERISLRRRIVDSVFLSLVFTFGIIAIWNIQYRLDPNLTAQSSAISNSAVVKTFMREYSKISLQRGYDPPRYIPTGIFVQSIEFVNATNVSLTGYVWQRYDGHDLVPTEPQIIFAEAIVADIQPAYREVDGGEIVQGWYFETELRERFDYSYYPFDRQSIWVRLWPQQFAGNVVLVPDFKSYDSLNPRSLPGLEDNFPLFGWEPELSYFDIRINRYNSNFGQEEYLSRGTVPELYFNIDVRRSFLNPFVSHLFPLTVVLLMLFALIVTMSKRKENSELLGFSVSSVVQSCTALFFVILIAHVQLREELSSNSIVYLEFFYFVSYVVLLMATINSILFSANVDIAMIQYRNNLVPKLLYWPFIAAVLFVCTALTFWT